MSDSTASLDSAPSLGQGSGGAASRVPLTAWVVFATAGLFVFYQLMLQALPSVIKDGLVVDFSLTNAGFGSLSASFFYPYMLLQLPSGLLVARFGSRRLLMAGLVLCISASLITAMSREVAHVAAARILMGVGAAPTFVATMALVASWFPARLFPILVALTETIGMLGAALGQETLGLIVQGAGWRVGMWLCAGFGAIVLVMTLIFVRDLPHPKPPGAAAVKPAPLGELMRMMLAPTLILSGLVGGTIYSVGLAFAMTWGVSFFQGHLGVDLATASFCAAFYSWGIIVGLPAFGWSCGRLASPPVLLAVGMLLTAGSVAVILYAPPSLVVACLGMLVCGIAGGSYALAFVLVKAQVSGAQSGAALAFANMLIIAVGGLVLQPLIGIVADWQGRSAADPDVLGILLWAQGVGLILLLALAWRMRARRVNGNAAVTG